MLLFIISSSGRKKIAANSRVSHVVSHFVLNDSTIAKQIQILKNSKELKEIGKSSSSLSDTSRNISPKRSTPSLLSSHSNLQNNENIHSRHETPGKRRSPSPYMKETPNSTDSKSRSVNSITRTKSEGNFCSNYSY